MGTPAGQTLRTSLLPLLCPSTKKQRDANAEHSRQGCENLPMTSRRVTTVASCSHMNYRLTAGVAYCLVVCRANNFRMRVVRFDAVRRLQSAVCNVSALHMPSIVV